MKVWEISELLNQIAPYKTAYDFDNVGLLVGDQQQEVYKIMLALDAAPEVVEQAIAAKVQLLITHHPLIFKPLKSLTSDTPNGQLLLKLIQNNIALIALHTNLDIAPAGVNDQLAKIAGLQTIATVPTQSLDPFVKLSLFTPNTHTDCILELLDSLHIKILGNYESCSFTTAGTGRFKPLADAQPFIGSQGKLCAVAENKLELLLPKERAPEIITKIKQIHPYEQMAYDLVEVLLPNIEQGILRIGKLPVPLTAKELAKKLKQKMSLEYVLLANPDKLILTLAVCGGTGADFIAAAKSAGADALLTGDIKYHEAQAAQDSGIAILAIGHQESEQPIIWHLAEQLSQALHTAAIQISIAQQNKILHCI